jgi:hypothetical protein
VTIQAEKRTGAYPDLRFYTGGEEKMRLDSSGNLGIGDTDPVGKFHIKGSGTSGQVSANLILENSSSGTAGLQITGGAGSSHLDFMYAGGPGPGTNTFTTGLSMMLEGSNSGNVGIGTPSPSSPLTLHGNMRFNTTNSDGNEQRALFNVGGASDPFSITGYKGDASTVGMVLNAGGVSYFNGGNVGIGTDDPDAQFEVKGNAVKSRFTRSGSAGTNVEFYYGSIPAGGIQVNSTGLGISGGIRENDLFIDSSGNVDITSGTFKRGKTYPEKLTETITGGFENGCTVNTWYNITNVSNWNSYLGGYSAGNKGFHFEIHWTSGVTSQGYNHTVVGWCPPSSTNTHTSYSSSSFVTHNSGSTMTSGIPITVHHHTSVSSAHDIRVRTFNDGASYGPLRLQIYASTSPNAGNAQITFWRA